MFKKKKSSKLKGVAIMAGVASAAAGIAAVALKDKKNQKKAHAFANKARNKGSQILKSAQDKLKKVEKKESKAKITKKKVVKKAK